MITVVNKRTHTPTDHDEFICRGKSSLGNPWTHMEGPTRAEFKCATREESIQKFSEWLDKQIAERSNRKVLDELNRLYSIAKNGDLNLVCWCVPLNCHGHKIKSVIESKLYARQ